MVNYDVNNDVRNYSTIQLLIFKNELITDHTGDRLAF